MLKPRLKARASVPYGGRYDLSIPEKGMVGFGTNFDMLLDNIRAYRKANAMPIGLEFESEVERETCLHYPQECRDADPRIPQTQQRLGAGDVVRGTRLMLKHRLAGSPLVDQQTANARAAICAVCSFQRTIALPCGSGGICQELKDLVKGVIGARRTPYDSQLKSCGICHCDTSTAVHVPLELQWSVLTKVQKDQFDLARTEVNCWKYVKE